MKSVMMHSFSDTPTISAPRSTFNRSFGHKTTFDASWLVPFFWDPVIPGDTFNVNATLFARLNTPIFPILDNAYLDTHYFFVPYRILWDNWKKFCGEQENPNDSIDFTIPIISASTQTATSLGNPDLSTDDGRTSALMNYLGLPHGYDPFVVGSDASALPFRAYSRIYNEWFRDQNLIDSVDAGLITGDGPDDLDTAASQHMLQRRGKRHDYFTSALPNPQRGDAVNLPLGTTAPVQGIGIRGAAATSVFSDIKETPSTDTTYTGWTIEGAGGGTPAVGESWLGVEQGVSGYPAIYADLTNATASTVNDLREAFQVQKLLERDARSGTRYSELIRNHFGVDFYDVAYRPEYLGGGSTPINITPVAQTAATLINGDQSGVGDLKAFGTANSNTGFSKSFVEHGLVMGLLSVRADLTYQQSLSRHFQHSTRYDIYWPSLAHLGEQAILNSEIHWIGNAGDADVFGYQERYAEYRYKPSMITGLFNSHVGADSLDAWHLSQEFAGVPTLSKTFIEEDVPFDRVVQTQSEPHFILDSYIKMICARPMPVFGVPGMIDHF